MGEAYQAALGVGEPLRKWKISREEAIGRILDEEYPQFASMMWKTELLLIVLYGQAFLATLILVELGVLTENNKILIPVGLLYGGLGFLSATLISRRNAWGTFLAFMFALPSVFGLYGFAIFSLLLSTETQDFIVGKQIKSG